MTRRRFLPAAAAASAAGMAAPADTNLAIFEVRIAYLRNGADQQRQRMADFIEKSTLPALQKYGAGPVGVFSNLIAPDGIEAGANGDRIEVGKVTLTYKAGLMTSVRIFDGKTGEMIREIPIVSE